MKKNAVIVITYNNQENIQKCLNSILNNAKCLKSATKIFVIDNNSRDKTVSIIKRKYKNQAVKLIKNKANTGFAKAVNQGIKKALKQDFFSNILLINPDTQLKKESLKQLIKETKRFDIISPKIKHPQGTTLFESGELNWLKMKATHSNKKKPDYLTGACLLIKSSVFKKIGFLDESYFLYYEDADFCLRAKKAGFKLKTLLNTTIFHTESHSSNSKTKNYHLVKSGLIFFHKNYPSYLKPYFWAFFYLRLLYHQFSGKKEIKKALKDFKRFTKKKK
ncbi:MAG: glycosyltransferase family 2 protein [Candidatus Moraniibacteriota bacterium]